MKAGTNLTPRGRGWSFWAAEDEEEWHIIIGNDVVRGDGDTDNETDDECNELHRNLARLGFR